MNKELFDTLKELSISIREKQVLLLSYRKMAEKIKLDQDKEILKHKTFLLRAKDEGGKKAFTNETLREEALAEILEKSGTYQSAQKSIEDLHDKSDKEEIELGMLKRSFRIYEIVSRIE